jgi:hypothetical protein
MDGLAERGPEHPFEGRAIDRGSGNWPAAELVVGEVADDALEVAAAQGGA